MGVLEVIPRTISSTMSTYKCMFDDGWLSIQLDSQLLWNELVQLKFRHISTRFITRITRENLDYCTRLMKYVELRHVDNVIGYLGIKDTKEHFIYVSTVLEHLDCESIKLINAETDLILSSNQSFVQMQDYFFDRVWSLATPAIQRIADLERKESARGKINKVISDKSEIHDAVTSIIESSRSEILVVFPYANTFWCSESAGIVASLGQKIKHNVAVRAIVHIDKDDDEAEDAKERIRHALRQKNNDLYANIVFLTKDMRDRNMFFVVDQAILLSVDVIDKAKEALTEILGSATFSNNETSVSATISVFDTLWIQAELEKQNQAKQAYFHIFKGFKLREEEYRRKWLFEQEE